MIIGNDGLRLTGRLEEIARMPVCTSAALALVRIRAVLLTDDPAIDKLSLIAAIAIEGVAAEEHQQFLDLAAE